MQTKIVALDVYGTILNSEDIENALPPIKGFGKFVVSVKQNNLILVTSSDADLNNLRLDLEATLSKIGLGLGIFDGFYKLDTCPKDFRGIIDEYGIKPEQLFVVGDNYFKDIVGAEEIGCSVLRVPEYGRIDYEFDFATVEIP